jgi:hypothetical protein
VAPGTVVTINGESYVAVQVPARQFTLDKRYAVRFLTPLTSEDEMDFINAHLSTVHSTDALPAQNATIDGLPAQISVTDGRTYAVVSGVDYLAEPPTVANRLEVDSYATATVQIKAGDTLMTLTAYLIKEDQNVALPENDQYRGTAVAAYGKYTDPVALLGQGSGLDKWIDYIRVIALN